MAAVEVDGNPNNILLAGQLKSTQKFGITSNANRQKFNNYLTTPTKTPENIGQLKNDADYNTPDKEEKTIQFC